MSRQMRGLVVASACVFVSACAQTPPPPPPKTVTVTMADVGFAPPAVTARVGDTLAWVNKDIFDHTGTARNGTFDVAIEPGKSGQTVLKSEGTIEYYCKLHPTMVGQVVVTK